jgi:UTP-glucose-1-phosphate uridylyltransferase
MNAPTLVVLAAGLGSRYGGLKQIEPVGPNGEWLIEYSVFDALRAGFGKLVFIIRPEIEEALRALVQERFAGRVAVEYAHQRLDDLPAGFAVPADRQKPWGTAHAARAARHAVREPFALINADDFYGRQSFELLAHRLGALPPHGREHGLVCFRLRNTLSEHGAVSRGICKVDPAGRLLSVTERREVEKHDATARCKIDNTWVPLTGHEPVSMNCWAFHPAIFPRLDQEFATYLHHATRTLHSEFQLPTVVNALIKGGNATFHAALTDARWFGITYPDDKPVVVEGIRALVTAGAYPNPLWR